MRKRSSANLRADNIIEHNTAVEKIARLRAEGKEIPKSLTPYLNANINPTTPAVDKVILAR